MKKTCLNFSLNKYFIYPTIILSFLFFPNLRQISAESNSFEEIDKVKMEHLDTNLPDSHQLALKRINQYRLKMGLPVWIYDSSLTKMAQAHADYVLINCKAGRKKFGHYEDPSYSNYTKEGDEAARTSGLSGGPDPLYGLERLIEGVFHRVQFTKPSAMRVGIGFSYDSKNSCGSTLFVSRKLNEADTSVQEESEFIVFPPDGFEDTLTKFISEWPDPRPQPSKEHSGYMASIQIPNRLKSNLISSTITMKNSKGNEIDLMVTDPKNPTYKNPPAGMLEVYGKASGNNHFSDNFGMVFIMPKEKLELNETYTIDAKLEFSETTKDISWMFKTRKNNTWKVQPEAKEFDKENLGFLRTHLYPNDTLSFSKGKFELDNILWFDESIHIRGEGIDKTFLSFKNPSSDKGYMLNFKGKENSISQLSFEPLKMGGLYTRDETSLNMDSIHLKNTSNTAIQISPKSKLISKNSTFTNLGSRKSVPFCIRKEGEFILESGNYFEGINNKTGACGSSIQVANKTWNVANKSNPIDKTISLFDAFNLAGSDDTLQLSSGVYDFASSVWIQNNLKMKGNSEVKIINSNKNPIFLVAKDVQFSLTDVNLEGDCAFFYLKENAKVHLNKNKVSTKSSQCYFASLDGDSELDILDSEFSDYFSDLFLFSRSMLGKFQNTNTVFPNGKSIQAKETMKTGYILRIK